MENPKDYMLDEKGVFCDDLREINRNFAWKKHYLSAEELLKEARRPDSQIHEYFDWDDKIAAEKEKQFIAFELVETGIFEKHPDIAGPAPTVEDVRTALDTSEILRKHFSFTREQLADMWRMEQAIFRLAMGENSLLEVLSDVLEPAYGDHYEMPQVIPALDDADQFLSFMRGLFTMERNEDVKRVLMRKTLWALVNDYYSWMDLPYVTRHCTIEGDTIFSDMAHERETGLCVSCQGTVQRFLSSDDISDIILYIEFKTIDLDRLKMAGTLGNKSLEEAVDILWHDDSMFVVNKFGKSRGDEVK